MSDEGHPTLTALLGLLAITGYQNRDKLADLFRTSGEPAGQPEVQSTDSAPSGGGLSGMIGGAGIASVLHGGFSELIKRFNQSGHKDLADSWVSVDQNKVASEGQVTKVIGRDVLDSLSERTGLPSDEIARRLAVVLPEAVDKYTPDGRLPDPG